VAAQAKGERDGHFRRALPHQLVVALGPRVPTATTSSRRAARSARAIVARDAADANASESIAASA
jgi:hypothetical protein